MQRHRHQEFIRFLNAVECQVPKDKAIHVILDKSMVIRPSIPLCEAGVGSKPTTGAVHKHPEVRAWLARHPRWTFHFTPTSASWLNAVESFFAKLSRRKLQRGVFHSVVALQSAINDFVEQISDLDLGQSTDTEGLRREFGVRTSGHPIENTVIRWRQEVAGR